MVMMSIVIGTMIRITIGGAGEKSGAGSGEKLGELGEKLPGCIFCQDFVFPSRKDHWPPLGGSDGSDQGSPLTCVTQILITQYWLVLQQYNKNVPSFIRNPINKSSFSEASWFMFGGQQSSEFPGLVWFAVANCPGGDSLCQLARKYIITVLNLFCWRRMMMKMMMATVCQRAGKHIIAKLNLFLNTLLHCSL